MWLKLIYYIMRMLNLASKVLVCNLKRITLRPKKKTRLK